MPLDYLAILMIIAVLSIVQSFFGMGVLVFGTPTLLVMGYDFPTTLGHLLPASFAISLLQVLTAGPSRVRVSPYLYLLCLPGIFVGLLMVNANSMMSLTHVLVGGMLLLSAFLRFWSPSKAALEVMLRKNLRAYHLFMGVIHGMTNMGGAFLAVLASGTHTEKEAIRYTVAHYYLVFSIVQMLTLATVLEHHDFFVTSFPAAVISSSVFFLVGNRFFIRATDLPPPSGPAPMREFGAVLCPAEQAGA